jgi:hypothetical protein
MLPPRRSMLAAAVSLGREVRVRGALNHCESDQTQRGWSRKGVPPRGGQRGTPQTLGAGASAGSTVAPASYWGSFWSLDGDRHGGAGSPRGTTNSQATGYGLLTAVAEHVTQRIAGAPKEEGQCTDLIHST